MSAWIRVCSNGRGRASFTNTDGEEQSYQAQRFVFFGGKDYQSIFGLKNTTTSPNSQIIGYMPNSTSTLHIIENERNSQYPIHVPTPEISRVEMTIQKEVLRRAVIEWTCFSWKQLEYMTPYFLVPGITMMIEMGWNHFNPESLVDITNEQLMKNLWDNPYPLYEKNIIDSKGNYDVIYGMITNFNWSVEGNNRYVCTTEITSKNRLYAGISIDSEMIDRKEEENDGVKTLGNLLDFLNNSNTIMNFRQLARYGPDNFLKGVYEDVSSLSDYTIKDYVRQISATIGLGQLVGTAVEASQTVNRQSIKSAYAVSATFQSFFESLKIDIDTSKLSEENKKLRTSYLYGVFDGRSHNLRDVNKVKTPNEGDFDRQESNENVWFNMGLISLIINYFSARWSVSDSNPLVELDIDNVIIGAHRNLISADGNVLLIPNPEAPKYFWGDKGSQNAINENNTEWENQAILGNSFTDSKKLPADDKLIKKLFYFSNKVARDNHDLIINRYTYRLTKDGKAAEALAEKGSRSFPSNSNADNNIHGYLRDLYFNANKFIQLVKSSETFYELINKILTAINNAGANFWELRPVDNQRGKIGVVDLNYAGRGLNLEVNSKVLSFDMHDANNIVKSFKFRPQLTDSQTTRALYGQVANPATQFYSKEEKEDMEWSFKDALMQNTVENSGTTVLSTRRKSLEDWKSTLFAIQRINDFTDTYQMKLEWGDLTDDPMIEDYKSQLDPFHRHIYVKLALPSGVGRSVLRKMLDDLNFEENQKYCAIQPGINAEITLQGIGGLRTFQCFLIKNLPKPYSEDRIVFQIVNVMDHIEAGNWETTIVAGIRPLRKFISNKLGIKIS